jgi:hypothetical protein
VSAQYAMKIVLRHQVTGRYLAPLGRWVRRADNALAFDDMTSAFDFSQSNRVDDAQPVWRFAPYLRELLAQSENRVWRRLGRDVAVGRDVEAADDCIWN